MIAVTYQIIRKIYYEEKNELRRVRTAIRSRFLEKVILLKKGRAFASSP